jgi:hypothetical protein
MSDLTINPENVRLAVEASSLDVEYISKNIKR